MKKSGKSLSYKSSFDELQKILESMEQGDIDVDELSSGIKRAAELIETCQKKLKGADLEVKRVVDRFEKQFKTDGKAEGEEPF